MFYCVHDVFFSANTIQIMIPIRRAISYTQHSISYNGGSELYFCMAEFATFAAGFKHESTLKS